MRPVHKDASLDWLAERVNVAQFSAFMRSANGRPRQTYSRILGETPNRRLPNIRDTVELLLTRSSDRMVNVRSFKPHDSQAKPFSYGLKTIEDVLGVVNQRFDEGLRVIVNETIDIHDGGFSGVAENGFCEFSPDDTPRCVEVPGFCRLSIEWTEKVIQIIYGSKTDLSLGRKQRLEFSIHPRPRGWRHSKTIGWELGASQTPSGKSEIHWPNRFSRFLGDKTFGLLLAFLSNEPVPLTTVFHRGLSRQFSFGSKTGMADVWVRTSPRDQSLDAGKFSTVHGWAPPLELLQQQERKATLLRDVDTGKRVLAFKLPSVLVQAAVKPEFSGKTITEVNKYGKHIAISNGTKGKGDAYMRGDSVRPLSNALELEVDKVHRRLMRRFGPVEFEWVYDGERIWVVQLHQGVAPGSGDILVPGNPKKWVYVDAKIDLEALRLIVKRLDPESGIMIQGRIGLTSHKADILRRTGFPARVDVFAKSRKIITP